MNWIEKVRIRMARSGKSYRTVCRETGAAGGRACAAKKRRAAERAAKFHEEQQRQVAQRLRDADDIMSPQDIENMAREGRGGIAAKLGARR